MLNVHFLYLLCSMYTWLVPHLYMINGMWNKWNETRIRESAKLSLWKSYLKNNTLSIASEILLSFSINMEKIQSKWNTQYKYTTYTWPLYSAYIHTYSLHQSSLCRNCIWTWHMSINIWQYKTHTQKNIHKIRVTQNKQHIHAQWNNYMYKAYLMTFEIFQSYNFKINT